MSKITEIDLTTKDSGNRRVLFDFPKGVDTHPFWAFIKALGLDKYIVEEDNSWLEDPTVMESIHKGEQDIAEGRATKMSSKEIRTLLGL
ncbi:MAG: hypothetical protein HUK15_07400 [Bacteroidales bacterium]|nr:hypothetical protein [Bacteroidales bacterium]